tara:strand:- start:25178 stop:26134 length:957 start_codon:yes stop_codon:yes gene_type:complete
MNRLKFSIKPNLKIKEFKNLIVKFKKNKNYKINNIKWDYFSNPFGKSKFFIAKYDSVIVGMIVCFKQIYINKDKKFLGYRIQDVITDTKMIRNLIKNDKNFLSKNKRGIFENLIMKLNDYLKKRSEINLGFANHLAFPYWKRNLWKDLSNFPNYEKKLSTKKSFNLEFKKIRRFNINHEKIFLTNLNKKINIFWSSSYLNWRYIENPRSNYYLYEFFNQKKLIGYTILKEYVSDKEKIGHICQIISTPQFKKEIISFANNFFLNKNIFKISQWSSDHNLMRKTNFVKNFTENKKIVYFGKLKLNKQNFDLNMGFSDIY